MLCRAIVLGKYYIGEFETNGFDVKTGSYVEVLTRDGKREAVILDFSVEEDIHILKYCPVVSVKGWEDYLCAYDIFSTVFHMYKGGSIQADECICLFNEVERICREKGTKPYEIIEKWEIPKQTLFHLIVDELLPLFRQDIEDKDFVFWKAYRELWNKYIDKKELYEGDRGIRLKHDPVEDTDKYIRIECEVERETNKLCKSSKTNGIYFTPARDVWAMKKCILKEKYGIDWKTPKEMNPDVHFY